MGIISIHWSFHALLTFQKRYFIIFNHQSLEHRNCLFARKTNQHKATSFPNAYISAKKQNKTCHYVRNVPFLRCLFLRYLRTHRPLSANYQIMKHHQHAAFQLTSDSNHEHTDIHNPLTALPLPYTSVPASGSSGKTKYLYTLQVQTDPGFHHHPLTSERAGFPSHRPQPPRTFPLLAGVGEELPY